MPFSLYNIHFESYIKPQLSYRIIGRIKRCISFDSYIKPQLSDAAEDVGSAVYLLIPTSNHNRAHGYKGIGGVYIFWFLHQTTTTLLLARMRMGCISFDSYIKPQLLLRMPILYQSCISFDSYIKPQPMRNPGLFASVVYLLIPTSNHNSVPLESRRYQVVYLLIPTSNHNLTWVKNHHGLVVYLLIPTSNHNLRLLQVSQEQVVYLLIPTSNHNLLPRAPGSPFVVYLLIPTSNHNELYLRCRAK